MITNAGGGYSRWKDIAVTRWREDFTRDNWGTFCYLRDVENGAFWSTTYQPTLNPSAVYQANFSEACAAFRCYEQGMDAHTQIAVSPEDDIEVRRIGITNRSGVRKAIDLTSYAEVVIALAAADAAHPAFSNLFVQTEIVREQQAILCNRRSGAAGHAALWMFHLLSPRVGYRATCPMKQTGCVSSAAEIRLSIPRRCVMLRRCRAARVPCLIRLSLSDAG